MTFSFYFLRFVREWSSRAKRVREAIREVSCNVRMYKSLGSIMPCREIHVVRSMDECKYRTKKASGEVSSSFCVLWEFGLSSLASSSLLYLAWGRIFRARQGLTIVFLSQSFSFPLCHISYNQFRLSIISVEACMRKMLIAWPNILLRPFCYRNFLTKISSQSLIAILCRTLFL